VPHKLSWVLAILAFPLIMLFACLSAGKGADVQPPEAVTPGAVTRDVPQEEAVTLSPEASAERPPEPAFPQGPVAAALPGSLRPGEPFTAAFAGWDTGEDAGKEGPSFRAVLTDASGKRLCAAALFDLPPEEGFPAMKAAVMAVPSTVTGGPLILRVEASGKGASGGASPIAQASINIEERSFVSEEIPLGKQNTEIRTVPDPQKTRESEALSAILWSSGKVIYDDGPFTPPVTSTRRTSFFGDRRVYLYDNGTRGTSIHAGVDYGVPLGTEVRASARGRAAMARFRIVTGNSVVLEHLPGLYSIYYHLDRITVEEGAVVERGALLGYSGSTGLSTGPHLHWEVRAAGENADPDAFLARPALDKKALAATLAESAKRTAESSGSDRGAAF